LPAEFQDNDNCAAIISQPLSRAHGQISHTFHSPRSDPARGTRSDAERGGQGEAAHGINNRMQALRDYYPEALGLPGRGHYGITGYLRFAPEWAEIGSRSNITTDVIAGTMGTCEFMVVENAERTWDILVDCAVFPTDSEG